MIYYIYRINFLCGDCAGRYYLGMHSAPTWEEADAYTGSGNFCKRYFKKYGKDNTYTKDILNFADTRKELFEMETLYIGDLWKNDPLCVNMKSGGCGGSEKGTKGGYTLEFTPEHCKNISKALKGKIVSSMKGKHHTEEAKEKNRIAHLRENLSDETLYKMSVATRNRMKDFWTDERKKQWSEHMKSVEGNGKWEKGHETWNKGKECAYLHGVKWMNNGEICIRVQPPKDIEMLKLGFQYGRLKRK